MYKIKNQKSKSIKSRKLVALLLLIPFLAAAGVYAFISANNSNSNQTAGSSDSSIDYSPPSEQEQQSGDAKKEEIIKEQEERNSDNAPSNESNGSNKKDANVIITFAGQEGQTIEVNAFVSDHIEEGTCTIIFRQGSQTVTKEAPAHADASSTICTNPEINRSEFPSSGTWTVQVVYESDGAKGESSERELQIN